MPWSKIRNIILQSAIVDNPAVMTAGGWKVENDGKVVNKETEGTKQLQTILPIIGLTGLAGYTLAPLASSKALDVIDSTSSLLEGNYVDAVLNFLPANKLMQLIYYLPKTKKVFKKAIDYYLDNNMISNNTYSKLINYKIRTGPTFAHFPTTLEITVLPKYKGLDGGFSIGHEIGHAIGEILKKSYKDPNRFYFDFLQKHNGHNYKYTQEVDDNYDKVLENFFADYFGFKLGKEKSLNFDKDYTKPDMIERYNYFKKNVNLNKYHESNLQ